MSILLRSFCSLSSLVVRSLGWDEKVFDGEVCADEEVFSKKSIIRNEGVRSKTMCADISVPDDHIWDLVLSDVNVMSAWKSDEAKTRLLFGIKFSNGNIAWLCMTPCRRGRTKAVTMAGERSKNCVIDIQDTSISIILEGKLYSWRHDMKNYFDKIDMEEDINAGRSGSSNSLTQTNSEFKSFSNLVRTNSSDILREIPSTSTEKLMIRKESRISSNHGSNTSFVLARSFDQPGNDIIRSALRRPFSHSGIITSSD